MIRKSLNTSKSIKGSTDFNESKPIKRKSRFSEESQQEIYNCLHCKKPASECKGNCYGRSN